MPSNKLTDTDCKGAKPREKPYKLFDGEGLFLFVSPAGGKHWRLQYRSSGKQQTMSLGSYPMVPLREARSRAAEARKRIAEGLVAPARPKPSKTFREAAAAYWAQRLDVSDGYRRNATRALEMHVFPTLADRPVAEVARADLLDVFNVMNAAGLFSYVRKTRMWVSCVLDWAVEQGLAEVNVARLIDPEKAFGRREVEHHASLKPREVRPLLERLALEDDLNSVLALWLLMLTWVRTDELRCMRWSEIEGDLWRIPAARMKRRLEHVVPLSRQAQALLGVLKARSKSEFVFPNDRRLDRPMSENAVLYLLGRIGYGGKATGHGFRTTGSTWANEAGYNPDAIERQLAHRPADKIRAIYNAAEYLPIRRQILQDYADWLQAQAPRLPFPVSTDASLKSVA